MLVSQVLIFCSSVTPQLWLRIDFHFLLPLLPAFLSKNNTPGPAHAHTRFWPSLNLEGGRVVEFQKVGLRYPFFFFFLNHFWLCWVFVSVRGLSLAAASEGHSSLWCAGLSLSRPLLLRSTGSRREGSVVVAHGPSCSAVCGIFPDQGSNPRPLHWQADSQPLRHQGSPIYF